MKWGALLHLAKTLSIPQIVWVAYYRRGDDPILQTPTGDVALPSAVWNHFSDLRHIERLSEVTGVKIYVLDNEFDPRNRPGYIGNAVRHVAAVKNPKIVFLDPDTGIEPGIAGPEHVTKADVIAIWDGLSVGDVLVIYQHADRTSTWTDARAQTMSAACGGAPVQVILGKGVASDVAMLYCEKR